MSTTFTLAPFGTGSSSQSATAVTLQWGAASSVLAVLHADAVSGGGGYPTGAANVPGMTLAVGSEFFGNTGASATLSGTPTSGGVFAIMLEDEFGRSGNGTITVVDAPQTIAPFSTIPTVQLPSSPFTVSPPVASSGLPVTLSILSGPATISGNTITPTGTGTVVLAANQAGNTYYAAAAQVTASFAVIPPTVALSGLTQTYTGSPLPVTVTTTPPGLANSVTYNGSSTVPSATGSYAVVATITDSSAPGGISTSGTFTIVMRISGSPLVIPTVLATMTLSSFAWAPTPSPLAAKAADDLFVLVKFLDDSGATVSPVASGLTLTLREFASGDVILASDGFTLGVDTNGATFFLIHLSLAGHPLLDALLDNAHAGGGVARLIGALFWQQDNPFTAGPGIIAQESPGFEFDLTPNLQ